MRQESVKKRREITDAKIQFVSLVDRAANMRKFLVTKQDGKTAAFTTYGRIVKADEEEHYITGIVYEPMTEDSQGDYMTEDEIRKACYWFAKNSGKVDLQHNFDPLDSVVVVENWIARSDFETDGETAKKGSWVITVEIPEGEIWDAVKSGEITGFSMGGVGNYSEEEEELDKEVTKNKENVGLLKMLAKALGLTGEVVKADGESDAASDFWAKFNGLGGMLNNAGDYTNETIDETSAYTADIKAVMQELNGVLTTVLSADNADKLIAEIANNVEVGKVKEEPAEEETKEEETESKTEETVEVKDDMAEIKEALEAIKDAVITPKESEETPKEEKPEDEKVSKSEMENAISKSSGEIENALKDAVSEEVKKSVESMLKNTGFPSNLNDSNVVKEADDTHYLHGIL